MDQSTIVILRNMGHGTLVFRELDRGIPPLKSNNGDLLRIRRKIYLMDRNFSTLQFPLNIVNNSGNVRRLAISGVFVLLLSVLLIMPVSIQTKSVIISFCCSSCGMWFRSSTVFSAPLAIS